MLTRKTKANIRFRDADILKFIIVIIGVILHASMTFLSLTERISASLGRLYMMFESGKPGRVFVGTRTPHVVLHTGRSF